MTYAAWKLHNSSSVIWYLWSDGLISLKWYSFSYPVNESSQQISNQNHAKMNTICQDLPQVKPTLWFKCVMTSQGTGKGFGSFSSENGSEKSKAQWLMTSSAGFCSRNFLMWGDIEDSLKDCQRQWPWLEPQISGHRWAFHSLSHITRLYLKTLHD